VPPEDAKPVVPPEETRIAARRVAPRGTQLTALPPAVPAETRTP
jgi:hypothetical protein